MQNLFRKAMRRLGYAPIENSAPPDPWPNQADGLVQVPTILIFTPPNSGSTALSKYLCAHETISSFRDENDEMQWLIPGLCEQDRWFPEKLVSTRSIVGTLNKVAQEKLRTDPNIAYFVEKSPPNLVRSETLLSLFETTRVLINNRDPYANIASIIGRHKERGHRWFTREEVVAHTTQMWIYRARLLSEIADHLAAPILTYEGFCADPTRATTALGLALDQRDEAVQIKVKDYEGQGVVNMNARQIEKLSSGEVHQITEILKDATDLLDRFGYALRTE